MMNMPREEDRECEPAKSKGLLTELFEQEDLISSFGGLISERQKYRLNTALSLLKREMEVKGRRPSTIVLKNYIKLYEYAQGKRIELREEYNESYQKARELIPKKNP